jgi:hypothetical protein
MTTISTGCFANCQNLEAIVLPENIIDISDQAFSGCSAATGTIKVPSKIVRLGHNAFDDCSSITRFEFICEPDHVPEMHTVICRNCSSLKEINISEHLTLPSRMFAYCTGLEELEINNRLSDQVFSGCTGLKKLVSHSDYFGQQAFLGCSSLEFVKLTNKNLVLETYVFDQCAKMETFGPISDSGECPYDFNFA